MYQLPDMKPRKKPRAAYKKSAAVKFLEGLKNAEAQRLHPSIDPKYLAPYRYRDDNANGLTKCVIDFIRLSGHQAERVNSCGRYVDNSKVVTDVLDHRRVIGSARWLPTAGQKGTADISATINGRSVKIEVKIRDKQSEAQKAYQGNVEAAGGAYVIVRSFQELLDWHKEFTK